MFEPIGTNGRGCTVNNVMCCVLELLSALEQGILKETGQQKISKG